MELIIWFISKPTTRFIRQFSEKNIKHWPRAWKTRLIGQMNPEWRDLYAEIVC